jgi:hypothetical protein
VCINSNPKSCRIIVGHEKPASKLPLLLGNHTTSVSAIKLRVHEMPAKSGKNRREHQQKSFDISPELETWLLEAADKPTIPLTKSDFTAIRERMRAKAAAG